MSAANATACLSPKVRNIMQTRVDCELAVSTRRDDANFGDQQRWQRFIDEQLIEWGRNPSELEEEGTELPSKKTLQLAIRLASVLSARGQTAPTRVVPDVDGGIVFELQHRPFFETFSISSDGDLEYTAFKDCHIVLQERLTI